jgi:nitrate/nitrite transporter NarK
MKPAPLFWILSLLVISLAVADRILRKKNIRNSLVRASSSLAAIALLLAFLYAIYFGVFVGFPE